MMTARTNHHFPTGLVLLLSALLLTAACGGRPVEEGRLGGHIRMDGSSTVYPIAEAAAEEFREVQPAVRVTVGISGTGGGFKKFTRGETDVTNASRPIKESELEMAREGGVEFIELPVAYDGIAIVVNPANNWVERLTIDQLKRLWQPEAQGRITRWNQIDSSWPDVEIRLFGPGVDSGTYDYFTGAIVGQEGASRGDFTSSEDDNVLVQGVASDERALGFFGYAYYEENRERLKIVPIDGGAGPVFPTPETINNGTYQPLSRPVFMYVSVAAAERPEVTEFVRFYFREAGGLVREVGYIALPEEAYQLALDRFERRLAGTVFAGGGSQVGLTVEDLLRREAGQTN
jgi:phosphate transport system substrate-binding protein